MISYTIHTFTIHIYFSSRYIVLFNELDSHKSDHATCGRHWVVQEDIWLGPKVLWISRELEIPYPLATLHLESGQQFGGSFTEGQMPINCFKPWYGSSFYATMLTLSLAWVYFTNYRFVVHLMMIALHHLTEHGTAMMITAENKSSRKNSLSFSQDNSQGSIEYHRGVEGTNCPSLRDHLLSQRIAMAKRRHHESLNGFEAGRFQRMKGANAPLRSTTSMTLTMSTWMFGANSPNVPPPTSIVFLSKAFDAFDSGSWPLSLHT